MRAQRASVRSHRRTCGSALVAADFKTDGIARHLRTFLEKAGNDHVQLPRRSPSLPTFEQILSPAVTFAVKRLRRVAPLAIKEIFTASVWSDLGQHLMKRLMFALRPTLSFEQNVAKAVTRSLDGKNGAQAVEINLLQTIGAFPGLLETAAQLIAAWIDAQRHLFSCLLRDKKIISTTFLRRQKQLRITSLEPGLSDPHDGGRTVTAIRFVGNRRVIYKPRSSDGEERWFAALRWLNGNGFGISFRVPHLISREDCSWMEFLRRSNCQSCEAVRLFYFRWGAQAAVAQILGVSDLHRENWLAAGAQPLLLDAELVGKAEQGSRYYNGKMLNQLPALLETGLLPLTSGDRVGLYTGFAPLDAAILRKAPLSCWPRYRNVLQQPRKFVADLVHGFAAAVEILATPDSARTFFREIICRPSRNTRATRVLLRSSAEYVRLLRQSLNPMNMTSRTRRWQWLVEKCCASSLNGSVGLAEAAALRRCDLPKFAAPRPISWTQFSAAVAQLTASPRLLRRRVLLGTRNRHR